jgi:hypothetical protein
MAIGYYIELNPQGQIEQALFDETVGAAWRPKPAPATIPTLRSWATSLYRRLSTVWPATGPASSAPFTAA